MRGRYRTRYEGGNIWNSLEMIGIKEMYIRDSALPDSKITDNSIPGSGLSDSSIPDGSAVGSGSVRKSSCRSREKNSR